MQNFTANMDAVLAKLSCQALPCVIAGDLNIDLCKCSVNNDVAAYVDNLISNNFVTRFCVKSMSGCHATATVVLSQPTV